MRGWEHTNRDEGDHVQPFHNFALGVSPSPSTSWRWLAFEGWSDNIPPLSGNIPAPTHSHRSGLGPRECRARLAPDAKNCNALYSVCRRDPVPRTWRGMACAGCVAPHCVASLPCPSRSLRRPSPYPVP